VEVIFWFWFWSSILSEDSGETMYLLGLTYIERMEQQCHWCYVAKRRKRWFLLGLEPRTFCYAGRCPKPIRLEGIYNLRLASECIITDTNSTKKKVTNLSHKFREPITKTRYTYEINKVSSGFEYFFLIFIPGLPDQNIRNWIFFIEILKTSEYIFYKFRKKLEKQLPNILM